jgi:hypothetical protein
VATTYTHGFVRARTLFPPYSPLSPSMILSARAAQADNGLFAGLLGLQHTCQLAHKIAKHSA